MFLSHLLHLAKHLQLFVELSISITGYEVFLMFLLAYGLVEFPRALWNESDLHYALLLTQMKATSSYKAIGDYKINIQEDISKVHYFKDLVCTLMYNIFSDISMS